jgi:hypothetical protein
MEHKSNTQVIYLYIFLFPIGGGMSHHQAMSSTFEFWHNYYRKSSSRTYKGGRNKPEIFERFKCEFENESNGRKS